MRCVTILFVSLASVAAAYAQPPSVCDSACNARVLAIVDTHTHYDSVCAIGAAQTKCMTKFHSIDYPARPPIDFTGTLPFKLPGKPVAMVDYWFPKGAKDVCTIVTHFKVDADGYLLDYEIPMRYVGCAATRT
jgi:hypothetical protein